MEETGVTLHSDSLFSAICLALRELKGSRWLESEFLAAFLTPGGPPPVLISSLYPFAGEIFFLPRPLVAPRWPAGADELYLRKKTKAEFVSAEVFRHLVDGRPLDGNVLPETGAPDADVFVAGTWVSRQELPKLSSVTDAKGAVKPWDREGDAQRVTVDRRSSASDYFVTGRLSFHNRAGLYFLARWARSDHPLRPSVEDALRSLGETGLGGERSSGYGQFELVIRDDVDPLPDAAGQPYFTTLSVYCPTTDEVTAGVLGPGASYGLLVRRGWIASPQAGSLRRRSVRMLAEGSIMRSVPGRQVYGHLADTTPAEFDPASGRDGHKVYRCGLAFPVGVAAVAVGQPGVGGNV